MADNKKEKIVKDVVLISLNKDISFYDGDKIYKCFIFKDENSKEYIWKTDSPVYYRNNKDRAPIEGDSVNLSGSFSGEYDRKGRYILKRCTLNKIPNSRRVHIPNTASSEEKDKIISSQINSLNDGDKVINMPYSYYKQLFSDCKTVHKSFSREKNAKGTISVIIKKGRLLIDEDKPLRVLVTFERNYPRGRIYNTVISSSIEDAESLFRVIDPYYVVLNSKEYKEDEFVSI